MTTLFTEYQANGNAEIRTTERRIPGRRAVCFYSTGVVACYLRGENWDVGYYVNGFDAHVITWLIGRGILDLGKE